MIKRDNYINEIKKFMNKPIVKVITGMRRSGKSMVLKLVSQELVENGVEKKNIIEINFESLIFSELTEFKKLHAYIIEKAINSLMVDLDCDIYITGSNANLLSSELATYIAGRYIEIKVIHYHLRNI